MMSKTTDMLRHLSSAFSKDPDSTLGKYVSIIAAELEELDAAAEAVRAAHRVESATGASLDQVVDLIGMSRLPGESDTDFRPRAATLRWLQTSSGTMADLEAIVSYITGYPTDQFDILENPNAQGDGSGWGQQKWGNSPWGGAYNVGQIKIVFYTAPPSPVHLQTLYDAITAAKAGGILFLANLTTFELTQEGVELDLHLIAEIELDYSSSLMIIPLPTPPGWGRQKWGSSPWGSDGIAISHHETTVTPLP